MLHMSQAFFFVLAICFAVFGFKHKPKIVTRKFECMKKGTLIDSRTIKQFSAIWLMTRPLPDKANKITQIEVETCSVARGGRGCIAPAHWLVDQNAE